MNAGHKNVLLFLYIIYFFSYKIECSSRVSSKGVLGISFLETTVGLIILRCDNYLENYEERLRLLKETMPEG